MYRILSKQPGNLKNCRVAFLGGGGKTTLMFKIANSLSKYFNKVLVSSLTKSAVHPTEYYFPFQIESMDEISREFKVHNPLFTMKPYSEEKLAGLSETELELAAATSHACLFECDGARKKPVKIHLSHDPMVPEYSTHCVIVAGAEAVNTRLADGYIHRQQEFAAKWGLQPSSRITAKLLAKVMTDKYGYPEKIPAGIRVIYFINKADINKTNAVELAEEIFQIRNQPVFYGSLHKNFYAVIK